MSFIGCLQLVLGHVAVLLHLLREVVCLAADVADRYLRGIAHLRDLLGQLLAALLGQLREDEADRLAVVLRVDAEVGRPGSPSRCSCWSKRPTG